jgi:hypothetical protein
MAIYRLLRRSVFEPDDVRLLATYMRRSYALLGLSTERIREPS